MNISVKGRKRRIYLSYMDGHREFWLGGCEDCGRPRLYLEKPTLAVPAKAIKGRPEDHAWLCNKHRLARRWK